MVMDSNQNRYYTKIAEIIADGTNVYRIVGGKHYNIKFPYISHSFSFASFLEEYDPVYNYIPFNQFKRHVSHTYGVEDVEMVKVWQIYVDIIKDKYVYKNK
jgi:hypothetical protein